MIVLEFILKVMLGTISFLLSVVFISICCAMLAGPLSYAFEFHVGAVLPQCLSPWGDHLICAILPSAEL